MRDKEGSGRTEPQGRPLRFRGWAVPAGAVFVVIAAVIGILRLSGEPSAGEAGSAPRADVPATQTAVASPSRDPVQLANVWSVDVRTGRVTDLPRSIRSVASAEHFQASPDGSRLAFNGDGGIYVATIDGDHLRLIPGTAGAVAPSWSPDGKELVYSDGWRRGFVVNVRSGAIHQVIRAAGLMWHPNFSPDGRTILFTRQRRGALELRTIPTSGGASTTLLRLSSPHTGVAFGTYGPDGTIAYRKTQFDGVDVTEMTGGTALWLVDADGSHPRSLKVGCCWMSQIDGEALWPMWSPDGSRVAFERLYSRGVIVVDVGTGRHRLIDEGTHPAWIDDHRLILEAYGDGYVGS